MKTTTRRMRVSSGMSWRAVRLMRMGRSLRLNWCYAAFQALCLK